jgi:putative hemolysin
MQAIETGILKKPESIRIFRRVEPFVPILVENTRYILKTVDEYSELKDVMKLRSKVFSEEYGAQTSAPGFDVDDYDFQCDHLIIKEKASNKIIGTYRMLCSRFVSHFYSQNEFHLDEFLSAPGTKLELGRACIAPEHRRGATLSLLWRGIARYASETRSDYLFGCSSIKTTHPEQAKHLHDSLRAKGALSSDWNITPTEAYRIQNFDSLMSVPAEPPVAIPALLQSYLNAGAKIHGEPALDSEFNCIDLITILKLSELTQTHEKFYQI